MLEHIIDRAKIEGFTNFIISVFYLKDQIKEYFGDGKKWDVHINYIEETEPLGTAGALSLIEINLQYPFIVTNGDVITDIKYGDLIEYHNTHSSEATMAVVIATFKDLAFLFIGTLILCVMLSCNDLGTPALSLPNKSMSFFLNLNLWYNFFALVVIKTILEFLYLFKNESKSSYLTIWLNFA